MIKNFLKITLGVLFGAAVFTACSDDDDSVSGFSLSVDELTVAAGGAKETVFVETADSWVAMATEPWVMISPANGTGSAECSVVVDSTLQNDIRTANVRFTRSNGDVSSITVRQLGFNKMIVIETPEDEIEASAKKDERYYEAVVTTNVPFTINVDYAGADEWLSVEDTQIELDRGARPRTTKIRFDWKMNTNPEARVATVNFVPTNTEDALDEPAVLTLTQKAAVKIEDNRQGDSIALLTIHERLNPMSDGWDASENMINWDNVTLWEADDEELPCAEAVGRVRSATFFMFATEETIPQEVRYLKYAESLDFSSNTNTMLKSIELGSEICTLNHLKELTIFSYGISSLPDEFVNLGKSLEVLDLSANNLTDIPEYINPENFPKLKSIILTGMRRWTCSDLRNAGTYENGLGLHLNTATSNTLRRLLLWENLEELALSYCYLEGELPDFKVGEDGVTAYTQADVDAFGGDTIQYLADNNMPKVLPNMKALRLNLNFFTGNLPDWILYHPYLLMWYPESLIFSQQNSGRDSNGNLVRFDNEPATFDYYYSVFPGTREKYEFNDEITE